ncbi:MAG: lytic transglycosylase domain-containing protein, partial [Alphaproteobacteria bacterium]|nr:lytic transglycosylase domain-containing protein [Alphaproteobacteria bacterium]
MLGAVLAGACALAPAGPAAAQLNARDVQVYQQAYAAMERNRGPEALAIALRAGDPVLVPAIQWHLIRNKVTGFSFAEIEEFLRAKPGWPDEKSLRRRAEEAMDETVPDHVVLRWFQDRRPVTVNGANHLIRVQLARGVTGAAAETARAIWISGSYTPGMEQKFLKDYGQLLRPEDHAARLDRQLWDEQVADARRMLPLAPPLARQVAEARLNYMERKPNAERLAAALPAQAHRNGGLAFERLRWLRRDGDHDAAIAILLNPPADVGRPDRWWRERSYLVREMVKTGQTSVAYKLASQHENDDGTAFGEAEFLAGWIATRFLRDHVTAYAHFVSLYRGVQTPISLARGAYWAGRAADAANEKRIAKGWYEAAAQHAATFYGQLAGERIGQVGRLAIAAPPPATPQDRQRFHARELVRVAQALAQIGEADRAGPFFLVLESELRNPAELAMLSDLGRAIGRTDLALRAAKELLKGGFVLIDTLFPDAALPQSSDPEHSLVMALIRQESAFNPQAVSSAGARGLMQLMPQTAKAVAKGLGLPFNKDKLTKDVRYNMTLGRAFLSDVLGRFDGSYILALAAYNAGPHRVNQWIADYGDPRQPQVDPIDWIEMIPFNETRNYVQRVLESV